MLANIRCRILSRRAAILVLLFCAAALVHADEGKQTLTAKQRKSVQQIVEDLQENEKVPLRQIESMIRFCGIQYVQALLDETYELEASEGLMTTDGARRRTRGGVFFYLARYRMSPALRKLIYNRKGKVPGEQYD